MTSAGKSLDDGTLEYPPTKLYTGEICAEVCLEPARGGRLQLSLSARLAKGRGDTPYGKQGDQRFELEG